MHLPGFLQAIEAAHASSVSYPVFLLLLMVARGNAGFGVQFRLTLMRIRPFRLKAFFGGLTFFKEAGGENKFS